MTAPPMPALEGERLALRPASADDVDALVRVLNEPDVARWWGESDRDTVEELVADGETYAIVVGGEPAGIMLVDESDDPEYRSVGFDIAVSGRLRGLGYGREALRLAILHFRAKGHHRFTIDPAAANERAIRAYSAIGFKPVGVMRAYERDPHGGWRDGLLMDLLADELVDG